MGACPVRNRDSDRHKNLAVMRMRGSRAKKTAFTMTDASQVMICFFNILCRLRFLLSQSVLPWPRQAGG
eukprot:765540-Hanusia_phi.AAC.7